MKLWSALSDCNFVTRMLFKTKGYRWLFTVFIVTVYWWLCTDRFYQRTIVTTAVWLFLIKTSFIHSFICLNGLFCQRLPVMWSETVGLRTRPVWDQKKSVLVLHTIVLVLVFQVWCCEARSVTLVVIVLKNTATFQSLFIVSLFRAWNITTVEIYSGFYLLES